MKKTLLVTALVSVLGVSALAFAGPGGDCGGKGFGGPGAEEGAPPMFDLKDKLKLDDAQSTKLDDIMKEQRTKMDDARTQMRAQMKTLRTESETKIAAILTPEQATIFKQFQDDRQKREDERREELKKRLESGDF